jgi:hypothetical protein
MSYRPLKMEATISYDEVATLVGVNIPTLEPRPNFERIRTLRRHFERALQRLPCPQSIQHSWKGMVMARKLYALLTIQPFRLPTNPGVTSTYIRSQTPGQPVNNALRNPVFVNRKHYYYNAVFNY